MARQTAIILFTGKLGNNIGYERNGKHFLRSAPKAIRQTQATRRASRRFGACSTKGRLIRHAFYPELDVRCDSSHVNRLNKLLIQAAGDHTAIKDFRFNRTTGIDRFLPVSPEMNRNEVLHIPAQQITQREQFTALELKVIAVRIDFNNLQVTGTDTIAMMIDAGQPFNGTDIPLYVAGEGTLLLTIQIRGFHKDSPSANKQFLAADIITVIPPYVTKPTRWHTHPQRIIKQQPGPLISLSIPIRQMITQRE
ncbi:hypothetical protein SAMN05428949_7091 [Chitinophaga sp. YR627]|uniref:hypothetical protein n=1 Tax=Chitinophaga sp. YR627 TaxID=1881041 RepID=UPI0008EA73B4|nr:hypothetical protein [Chitinophaga sp. YR627]SFO99171.1 hypothetical protein SAMN05428949_7091 [Chitinophaga sp. YR627]